MSAQTVGKEKEARLNANTYERTKYLFTGWNTEQDGSGTAYEDGQKIKASGNITLYAQWEIVSIILDSSMDKWTDGNVYTMNSDVTIENRIDVLGNVTLILTDGYKLTASKGISVNEENNLTINANGAGTGILEATSDGGDAGIGGDVNHNSGTIIINGGTVNVSSIYFGAGIGGGRNGSGTVTVNGGNVTATSTEYGAAIGGGSEGNGTVTINGGNVTATAGLYGAAIGGGDDGNGTIIINGGTVSATVSHDEPGSGAGIGCGYCGSGGTVTINGGSVSSTVSKGLGAGIGGCLAGSGVDVTINGGTVVATATEDGAVGIGRGKFGADDGNLILGEGIALEVSSNNSDWSDYDGTTRQRYMRTK